MAEKSDFIQNFITYFKGVKTEWGKITWPTRAQVIVETIQVIIIVTIFTVMILVIDLLFKWILGFIPTM